METAGKLVDNDELRDALKENGIGRPSTRAAIIETLFKRNYIRKEKKNLIATPTGVELIQIIHEELLKSAELTGMWEKKLREIEKRTYNASQFLEELKQMVSEIVMSVLSDNSNRHITIQAPVSEKGEKTSAASASGKPKKSQRKERRESPRQRKRSKRPVRISLPMHWLAHLVRFAEKERLLKEKRLTAVPNGKAAVHSASRLSRAVAGL